MKNRLRQNSAVFLLVLAALIWGVAFVAQSVGSDHVGAFTFLTIRSFLAVIVLSPLALLRSRRIPPEEREGKRKKLWLGGFVCGAALMVASVFQQIGIADTSVGKSGFITALYIVIVPLLGIFLKKKVTPTLWLGVVLATVGMYLLCIKEGFSISRGDLLTFVCAICFSVQILAVDHFSPNLDGVALSCVQFLSCGVLSGIAMLLFETPSLPDIRAAWIPLLYTGIFSSGVAYTLQILGQKMLPATLASLIMSMESVFSALAGWVILRQTLSAKELLGCCLVFAAVLLAQIPPETFRRNKDGEKP